VLSPQTYGPFKAAWVRSVAGWIIKRARSNYPRDALSTRAIEELRVRANFTEVMDVAFRLPFTPAARPEGGPLRVGINVSGLMYDPHGQSAATKFSLDYVDYTKKLVTALTAEGAEIWLVSHVVGGSEDDPDDLSAAKKLQADFPALKIADRFRSASEAKSFIASMDFFVGGRMHACIGAFSASVPVVPVAYSRKFTGLFGSIGYDRLVDAHSMSVEQALQITLDAFHARDQVKQEIVPALALAKSRVDKYEDEITALLDEVASRRSNSGTRP